MAADMFIHVYEGLTEQDLADFFSNTLGSKYFNPRPSNNSRWDAAYEKVSNTPSIEVGEVSWLKAALLEDDSFLPEPVSAVHDLIGEHLPILDEILRDKILTAMGLANTTSYDVADPPKVLAFLNEHMGKRLFTVSW